MIRRALIVPVLFACSLLAACGGGEPTSRRSALGAPAPTAGAVGEALPASTVPTVSAAEAARQLLDFAQARYPEAFPGEPAILWFSPFAFRYYPATGLYLGVALHDEGGYKAGGVYLLRSDPGATPQSLGPAAGYVTPQRQQRTIELAHNALVADPARGVYYASVPSRVSGHGNRIATIDATSGATSYSAPVGAEPGALALAADGRSLYVALEGTGEVLRLALPGLQETGRARLPRFDDYSADSTQMLADEIAASPVEPGVIAVSLRHPQASSGRPVLLREMVVQPRRSSWSHNRLLFAPDGRHVLGLETMSSGFRLVKDEVLADGLATRETLGTRAGWYHRGFGATASAIVTHNNVWNAADLSLQGTLGLDAECLPRTATTLLCSPHGEAANPRVLTVDIATLSIRAELAAPYDADGARLVPGPGASVAWRAGFAEAASREAARIVLLRDELLRGELGAALAPTVPAQPTSAADGSLRLALPHNALIADAARGVYYASVSGRVIGNGNRIARIDARSGQVTFSPIVGSEPGALALARDGQSLYAALDGSGELLRLSLPGLQVLARLRLPVEEFDRAPLFVRSLAASPARADRVALLLRALDLQSVSNKLLLIDDMRVTVRGGGYHHDHGQIVFGADGQWLYGLENSVSSFALGRYEIGPDSLTERFPAASANTGFYWHAFDRVGSALVTRNKLWSASDLSLQATLPFDGECLPRSASRLLCLTRGHASGPRVLAVDVATRATQAELAVPFDAAAARLVIGPEDGIALRSGFSQPSSEMATDITLLRNEALR
jgi:hypothetical protein